MAKKVTTKKPLSVNLRSHALNATKSFQKPNKVTVTINGEKILTSAREARSMKKAANK